MSYPIPRSLVIEYDVPPAPTEGGYRDHNETAGRFRAYFRWWQGNRTGPSSLALLITLVAGLLIWLPIDLDPVIPIVGALLLLSMLFIYLWVERISLTVEDGILRVRTGPLPHPLAKPMTVNVDEVRTFAADDCSVLVKREWPEKDYVIESWSLVAHFHHGSQVVLISGAKGDVILPLAWQLNEQAFPRHR